jgi:hypothetical protein
VLLRPVPRQLRLGTALVVVVIGLTSTACATSPSPQASGGSPAASTSAEVAGSAATGGTQPLKPGGLAVGTRYEVGSLGVSVEADVDGWLAFLPAGGDAKIGREGVTVYFMAPTTILAPDGGPPVAAPSDPAELLDAIHATPIVTVVATEPFETDGLSGLSATLNASGGGPATPLLTTSSGEYGLVDGMGQWIVFEIDGRPIVLSIERADAPDVDAAWEIAGPLVKSLEAAEK